MVLFDEIEKAHPDVFNLLLQVLDEGHLTDNYGRVIDFKNTVVIMTSNLGARDIGKGPGLGFHSPSQMSQFDRMEQKVKEEIERAFNPEFINRLDDIVEFATLSRDQIGTIVELQVERVLQRIAARGITVTLTEKARELLGEMGYDPTYGARPLKRVIQKQLVDKLAIAVLEGEFREGDTVQVEAVDGELAFTKGVVPLGDPAISI